MKITKKRKISNSVSLLLIFVIILFVNTLAFATEEKTEIIDGLFTVTVDGNRVKFDSELGRPYLLKETGRTIIPLRVIAEMMGYDVSWGKEPLMAFVNSNDVEIELEIGKNTAMVNGRVVPIETKDGKLVNTKAILIPAKSSNRTYVPLRFIAESTNAEVDYKKINNTHYIDIYTKGYKSTKKKKPNNLTASVLCYSDYINMMNQPLS